MKINLNKNRNKIPFGEYKAGDVFVWNDSLFMKVSGTIKPLEVNCVSLTTGLTYHMGDEILTTAVMGEFNGQEV